MMLDILRQALASRIGDITIQFADETEASAFKASENIFQFLKDSGRTEDLKRLVINGVVNPLYGDMLDFIYEALTCLERRKTTVAFALLRKPLKYSQSMATLLWADEDDFFARLDQSPATEFDDSKIGPEKRKALLGLAISKFDGIAPFLDPDTLYTIIYDRTNEKGLAPYFDMAAHLVTSFKPIRTQPLNFNFIFKNPNDDDVYENIYFPLAYVLMYLFFLQLKTYSRMAVISESFVNWAQTALLGTFESVFDVPNGKTVITDWVNELFEPFLNCVVCEKKMTVTKETAARLFMAEEIVCPSCQAVQQFPLWWLLTQSDGRRNAPPDAPATEDAQ
ncbi:MAG TPA: hypothetical protein VHS78_09420 [Candidatus Elarobacter sp.]|jgi:hypothetical protein|nr:hypothetical protein [Candidatus Elarobacter sp.]